MDFKIIFRPDLDYYKEAYTEIVKSNGLKRFEPFFATIMIIFAVGLWYFDNSKVLGIFPIVFGALGVYEFYKVYSSRTKWINDRVKSGVTGQELQLRFTDELVMHSGPFSNGDIKWNGLKSIKQTKKGIILKPENGTVIYLPKTKFEGKDQIDFIINKGRK
jgi:hypothetical protein